MNQRIEPRILAALACCCALLGLFAVWGSVAQLVGIWQTDALKSVGMAVPPVCLVLILRDWRMIGWRAEGSWWGVFLFAALTLVLFIRDQAHFVVTVHKTWLLQLPPLPLIGVVYAASMVLIFGGRPLLLRAWFPVLLMAAVVPVPQFFSSRVDLPLQHAGALVARNFAHLIGVHLTADNLKLMFSPDTAMFIAPGCDGLRGSVTMGLVAVVVAYWNRFRWYLAVSVTLGGVLLGYAFNFVRLCAMVIYDRLTVTWPVLGPHEQTADHITGGIIFVCAVLLFLQAIERLKRPRPEPDGLEERRPVRALPVVLRTAVVLLFAVIFGLDYRHAMAEAASLRTARSYPPLPATIGTYHLTSTRLDTNSEGIVVYVFGDYAPAEPTRPHVTLGISPYLDSHDAEVCHIARGLDPLWRGQFEMPSAGRTLALTGLLYNDGAVQTLEASTSCDLLTCSQHMGSASSVVVTYARPRRDLPLTGGADARQVPVLLKAESTDAMAPVSAIEPQLAQSIQNFLAQGDLVAVTRPYMQR